MMKKEHLKFGAALLEARKKKGMTKRDCSSLIFKEDGSPISAQYLGDIESGHRNPPSKMIIEQLAALLDIPIEILYFHAGIFPGNLNHDADQERIIAAYHNFVKALI